jgi:hypothetical protein
MKEIELFRDVNLTSENLRFLDLIICDERQELYSIDMEMMILNNSLITLKSDLKNNPANPILHVELNKPN